MHIIDFKLDKCMVSSKYPFYACFKDFLCITSILITLCAHPCLYLYYECRLRSFRHTSSLKRSLGWLFPMIGVSSRFEDKMLFISSFDCISILRLYWCTRLLILFVLSIVLDSDWDKPRLFYSFMKKMLTSIVKSFKFSAS